MTTTCIKFRFGILLLVPLLAAGQSLEDKVSQARKLQMQSQLGLDEHAVDSLVRERKADASRARLPDSQATPSVPAAGSDSMLAGPSPLGFEGVWDEDTAFADTSAPVPADGKKGAVKPTRLRPRKPPQPKRYEQRIFASVDRSAFSAARGAVGRDYVLGPGDNFTVTMWGDKDKEYRLTLNADGKAFLEGVGLVSLAGMDLDAAQAALKQRLSRIYSGISRGTSFVEVSLVEAGPIKVFVLGEVKVPGGYVFTGNTSVLSALYFARGPTDIGTVRNLQLTRDGKKSPLDLYKYLMKGESLVPGQLKDGDILFAGRAEALVEISGDVGRPATYELRKGEGIKELLEYARGLNASAAQHKLTLQRVFPDGKVDYVDLAQPQEYLSGRQRGELQDGDKVTVRKSTELSRNFITVTGPVKYPGTYSADGIATLKDLVDKAGGLREDAFLGTAHVVRFEPDGSSRLQAHSLDAAGLAAPLEPKDNVFLYSIKEMYRPDSVKVYGAVFNPGAYEFREGMTANDLVMQAGGYLPQYERGRLLAFRGDALERKVEQVALSPDSSGPASAQAFVLKARDIVHVPIDPRWYEKEVVTLDGLFMRPGKYALLHPGEKLESVIARAGGFKPDAYVEGGRFFRSRDSVGRVGVDMRKAVRSPRSKANISLVDGDSLFVPGKLNTVKVIGEVGFETSVLFKEGKSVAYYIDKAGGFTRRSEKERIVVQYANGETSGGGTFDRKPDAGCVIYVPQGPEPKPLDVVSTINALLGTLGVIAALVLSIQAINNN